MLEVAAAHTEQDLPDEFAIAELSSESVIAFDDGGRIQYWNPAAEALFGWPALAMTGTSVAQLALAPDDEERALAQLLQEGVWQGRIQRRSRDGETIAADVRRHLRFDAAGQPRNVIEFALPASQANARPVGGVSTLDGFMAASWEIDITPAQPILARIAEQPGGADESDRDALYHALLMAARIVEVNERTARLVGGNRGRALMAGQSVSAFWPVQSRMILAQLIVDALGKPEGMRSRGQLPTVGILRDPITTVWRADADRPGRMFIMVTGIADDDRSYPFLRASEARYRKLIHHMPIALWQVDASHMGKIYAELRATGVSDFNSYLREHPELIEFAATTVIVTDVNRSAVDLVGGAGEQDLIRPVGYLFAESPETLRRVMIGRFSGSKHHSELTKLRTLDNQVLDVRLSVTYPEPVLELDTTIFSLENVTEQLRMEAQLRQVQADFSHAARISMLGELTSSIAHEVNQPLAAILTNAETSLRWLARAEPDIDKVRQLTTRVAASARRADDIVQRIRRMAAKQPPQPVPLALNELIEESLTFFRHEIETHDIKVTTSYARRLSRITGDRIQLQQVVVNLLMNAIQAIEGRDDGEIAVSTDTDTTGGAVFTLSDNGPGIAPENLTRIFDGFFTTKQQGMGIGLAVCQSIVTAHGGTLAAANRAEGGAEFRVTLPGAGVRANAERSGASASGPEYPTTA